MPDYWLWCAMGFQGIVGMMKKARDLGIAPTPEAMELLRKHLAELRQLIEE